MFLSKKYLQKPNDYFFFRFCLVFGVTFVRIARTIPAEFGRGEAHQSIRV